MNAASFERFDYRLRINKHIERRLVFDVLRAATARIGLSGHRYVGLGSLWFGDFRLAHRKLKINEMLSMEASNARRASFNRPYRAIEVKDGKTHQVLPKFDAAWWARPAVFWLDYDGRLTDEVVVDVDTVLSRTAPDSVLIVTLNAERRNYRSEDPQLDENDRVRTAVAGIEHLLGSKCVAPEFDATPIAAGGFSDISTSKFPEFMADAVSAYMGHKVVADARESEGDPLTFVPLYRLHHHDGTDMITVGGAICAEGRASQWRDCVNEHELVSAHGKGPTYTKLDLVPFTVKEKIALDLCLPNSAAPDFLRDARKNGLYMSDDDLSKYKRYYRHFPMFAEANI